MAEPAGPMTFRCPLAVRSTCPPARCTAATISLASLERQRFGVGCFFSAMPADLSIPGTLLTLPSWTAQPPLTSPHATAQRPRERHRRAMGHRPPGSSPATWSPSTPSGCDGWGCSSRRRTGGYSSFAPAATGSNAPCASDAARDWHRPPTRLELDLEEGLVVVEHLDGDAVPVP